MYSRRLLELDYLSASAPSRWAMHACIKASFKGKHIVKLFNATSKEWQGGG